jgi:hypothetical protein
MRNIVPGCKLLAAALCAVAPLSAAFGFDARPVLSHFPAIQRIEFSGLTG